MRLQRITMFIISVCALWALISVVANAEPGTQEDPLVSRSYVDQRITEVMRVFDNWGASGQASASGVTQQTGSVSFTPVLVLGGKTIYGGEGCEMIMRSGSGVIVTGTDGVINATTGADLKNGAKAPVNNLLIISRDDGRGVKVTGDTWFIVKGGYSIR